MSKSVLTQNKEVLTFLEEKNISKTSEKQYHYVLSQFEPYLKDKTIDDLEVVDIVKYCKSLKGEGVSDSTINNRKMILRSFLVWIKKQKNEEITKEDLDEIKGLLKIPERAVQWLNKEEVLKSIRNAKDILDKAFISFAALTGYRRSNIINLRKKHVQLRDKTIISPKVGAKGETSRRITDPLYEVLSEYIDSLGKKLKPNDYFFQKDGKKLTPRKIETIIRRNTKLLGRKITCHFYRHAYITNFYIQNDRDYIRTKEHTGLSDKALSRYINVVQLEGFKPIKY